MKLDQWEKEPLWLKVLTPYLKKKRAPELKGEPETGKWVRIPLESCLAANGEKTFADFKKGSENRLLIFFMGGGVSWNEYTAAHPASLYSKDRNLGFYTIHMDLFTDLRLDSGIFAERNENPFQNWSKLILIYDTGDFHAGTNDFPYTAQDGSKRICHHHGYTNYRKAMETVMKFVPDPECIAVTGCSGGAFGAALLTDDVMELYPACENITSVIDSGFFPLQGWHDIAQNVWKSPAEITERLHSDNITLDTLQALSKQRQDKVKILVTCSIRDEGLSRMINYIENGEFTFTKESGVRFQEWFGGTVKEMKETIPQAQFYITDCPEKKQKKTGLTKHCLLQDSVFYDYRIEGISCAEWIKETILGKQKNIGMKLLEENNEQNG
ncbi:MAG: hypothetical protein E7190_10660 [Erysipelotrichaceae bacterium]|nr:hypothetical protein [Erysipelotrichaceae bacterium]